MKKYMILSVVVSLFLFSYGCSSIRNVVNTFENIKRLQFKLDSVDNFRLCGINLSSKSSISDFTITEAATLTSSFANSQLPASLVLNVEARNPNDGTGGSSQTSATLTSFEWDLYIDDIKTVNGNIANPITIPGTGSSTVIPLSISVDIFQFFSSQSYDRLINLALALGGYNSSPTRLKLVAKPRISTMFGDLYMGSVTITDREFSN
ncbi:MAG: hypothetical protein APR63_04970 [Desulfuromonas sp. SDB]|nr:MAG: hypothetical protein APR63_04970 [Desulfuromonas sp. SDB]